MSGWGKQGGKKSGWGGGWNGGGGGKGAGGGGGGWAGGGGGKVAGGKYKPGKGKGGQVWWGDGGWDSWEVDGDWVEQESGERTTRILNRYQLPAALLRGAAGEQGTCFGRDKTQKKKSDIQILDPAALRSKMDPSNCHIVRRPGIGLSEGAGSLQCLREMAEAIQTGGLQSDPIVAFLSDPAVESALAALNFNIPDAERSKEKTGEKLWELFEALKSPAGEDAVAAARTVAVAGSRLYVCALQLLQVHAMAKKPAEWADAVPRTTTESRKAHAWFQEPRNEEVMYEALAAMMHEAREKLDNYAEGEQNSAADVLRQGAGARRPRADDDEESGDRHGKSGGKGKRAKGSDSEGSDSEGKRKKKDNKRKKKAKKKSSSSSTDSSPAPDKKKKKKQRGRGRSDPGAEESGKGAAGGSNRALPARADAPSDKEIAFTQWKASMAEEVAAKAQTLLSGSPSLQELQDLFGAVPPAVRDFAGVETFYMELGGMASAPKNEISKEPLTALKTVGAQAAAWFTSQQSLAAGSAGAAGAAKRASPAVPAAAAVAGAASAAKK